MNNSIILKKTIAIFIILIVCSCCSVDYDYNMDCVFVNDSSHAIVIEARNTKCEELRYVLLEPESSIKVGISGIGGYAGPDDFLGVDGCMVTFDSEISILHLWNDCMLGDRETHCIYDSQTYVYTSVSKEKYYRIMTYTFTDADYDYAVAHMAETAE